MPTIISGKHFKLTNALKEYVTRQFSKLQKYSPHTFTEMRAELDVDENQRSGDIYRVEMSVGLPGEYLKAGHKGGHMREAIDLCTDKLVRQIKKYKGKRVAKHQSRETIRK